jgi:hypothetical protein
MQFLIKENERKIEKFDLKFYLEQKNFAVASAISALETTNEIQKSYFKDTSNLELSDYVMRLYALLQGLFVSIDSLYALSLSLTKSKNFININNNKDLRQLKYIRNDVVGHPSNRVLNSDVLAYCILDNSSITLDKFSYRIYTKDEVSIKEVNVLEILSSYYKEANSLLDELYKISSSDKNKTKLESLISLVLDDYFLDREYLKSFEHFIDEYKKLYPSSKKEQHRILWRHNLIEKLSSHNIKNEEEKNTINYCIGLELIKIYELVYKNKYKVDTIKRTPMYISSFYRFLNKNKSLYSYLEYLSDSDHPLFLSSLKNLRTEAANKKIFGAVNYLDMILKAYSLSDMDFVYALALPIKEYKKK